MYPCTENFCLWKEFHLQLPETIQREIQSVLEKKELQKRVDIETFPETLFHCALPNKKGITISTMNLVQHAPRLIEYYQHDLRAFLCEQLQLNVFPTALNLPTSCALLIYENEGDWINWHYDYNYYDGRFFTVLVPVTQHATCTEFQFVGQNTEIKSINLSNENAVCFEGNYLYHRASKLCKNERRILLSCQFVTSNQMNAFNQLRLQLKDYAYTGNLGPNTRLGHGFDSI
jgi:hypothetical protein